MVYTDFKMGKGKKDQTTYTRQTPTQMRVI